MAKITRIEQSDRPSAVVQSGGIDTSAATVAGIGADIMGSLAGAVGAEEMAERKRMAEALAAKQAIVDESDSTILQIQAERRATEMANSLKITYADNPNGALDEFFKSYPSEMSAVKEQSPNERVALMATKAAGNVFAATMKDLQSWAFSRQTERVKGNMAQYETYMSNKSRDYATTDELNAAFDVVDKQPLFDAVYGKGAADQRYALKQRMANSFVTSLSERSPVSARALLNKGGGFLGKYLKDDDFTALRRRTEVDAKNIESREMFNTLTKFNVRGNKLLSLANQGELDAGTIQLELDALSAQEQSVRNSVADKAISEEAGRRQLAAIEEQRKYVGAVKRFQAVNTDTEYVNDEDVPAEIWTKRKDIRDADGNVPLEQILQYRRMILDSAYGKKVSPGRAATLLAEAALIIPPAVAETADNTGTLFGFAMPWQTAEQAGAAAMNRELQKQAQAVADDPKLKSKIVMQYVTDFVEYAKKNNTLPSEDVAARLGGAAYYKVAKQPIPSYYREPTARAK